ncbi:MAG: hypothetical protein MR966_02825 [Lachnospiraceae bacterium]|nr:hypothetical protein [Eubacterium sp.]MCI6430830.1 hypothetical protein [Lachnospiraceae bacterium]MCI7097847.1 hypothetical protein [Lachnospiraceae bacterium]MCI7323171.1 hypothetical protein [Lachnospiraceae bacterium]
MEKRFFLLYLPAGTSAQMICVEIRKIYGVEFVDFEKETNILTIVALKKNMERIIYASGIILKILNDRITMQEYRTLK